MELTTNRPKCDDIEQTQGWANRAWQRASSHERGIIRLGMIPISLLDAESEMYTARAQACALFNAAKADGGMRA